MQQQSSRESSASRSSGPVPPAIIADVLIVGGGFVGGALALALAKAGLAVALVEAADPAIRPAVDADGRATAIALTSRRLLTSLGVWDRRAADAGPMRDIRVTDGPSRMYLHYHYRDVGSEPFGHMVENRFLRPAIMDKARAADGVTFLAPARVADLEFGRARVKAWLEDGRCIRASLAVAADGRFSQVREMAGIAVTGWSYRQTGIVCAVSHERHHGWVAHEHFLPAGPFAILPLMPGTRSSIVWTERADLAPVLMAMDEADFLAELKRRFGDFLGAVRLEGKPIAYPLGLQYAHRTTGRRLALVGDAAHVMHPIAGQGLNMGFRDVAALAQALEDGLSQGHDLGSDRVLRRYARWRRFDNTLMLTLTDGLNRLFSNDIPPLRLMRDLGLAGVQQIGPLKRVFMRHAMGLEGNLPRLMQA
jgi:2-octaprenyl-6-methoxyphenol hydroxylase